MKRLVRECNFKIHFIASILLCTIIEIIGRYLMMRKESASIGIIGGADGPTAIFVSTKISGYFFLYLTYIILFIVLLVLYKPVKVIIEKYLTS